MGNDHTIEFTKMSGTGNDFIVIDAYHTTLDIDWSAFAAKYCPRRTGVGVDGLLLLGRSLTVDFDYRIFNADGSEAEMCGNGARCAAAFAVEHGFAGRNMRFTTRAGIIEARVNPDDVSIMMTPPHDLQKGIDLDMDGQKVQAHFINTGVPHAVLFTRELDDTDVHGLGRKIRTHKRFAPAGTNVNFVQVTGGTSIRVRTYERGVEAETLACGTGAVASAILSHAAGKVSGSPVRVSVPGGDLKIEFTCGDGEYRDVWLTGEVSYIFRGTLAV
ncbi:diaminopimelate epimerase [bacterium]|nr:diaminopimelate epimerase [bacterium]